MRYSTERSELMETLREWALTVALSALAGGIVWLLAPKGSVQKAVRAVVAVFLLCAFLSPLLARQGGSLEWELPELEQAPTLAGLDEAVSRQLQAAVEREIKGRIEGVLEARGIQCGPGQILLETDILPEGSINIAAARVILPLGKLPIGTDPAGLKEALGAAAGLEVEVTVK
jgi:hypothetical protein